MTASEYDAEMDAILARGARDGTNKGPRKADLKLKGPRKFGETTGYLLNNITFSSFIKYKIL